MLAAPIGLEDYRFYVPPTPTEKILENEDRLTAEGYRKQLETNYSLKLPPDQVTPFIDARFNIKGSAEYPRWLRAFVSSGQMIYREPVVHEIPLITRTDAVHHGRRRSQRAGPAECAGGAAAEDGPNAELARALAAKMPDARAEVITNAGASGVSRCAAKIRRTDAGVSRLPLVKPAAVAFIPRSGHRD